MWDPVTFEPGDYGFEGTKPIEVELPDPEATMAFGGALVELLGAGDVLGLVGQLGAGKTTLVRGVVRALGGGEPVRSPTYTLVNRYDTDPPVVHADLYRIESVEDLETTGYWDHVRRRDELLCVEWLDRVPTAWPGDGIVVELEHRDEGRAARIWASKTRRDAARALDGVDGGWR